MTDPDRVAEIVAAAREGRLPDTAPAGGRPQHRIRTVDWRRPTKFNAEQERRVKRFHDTFCQTVAVRLGTELRVPIDLEVINIAQVTWAKGHGDLPSNSICAALDTQPLGTPLVLATELPFVLFAIDRLLGGRAGANLPERRLTEIDWVLAGRLFTLLSEQLSVIWQDLAGLRLTVTSVDTQPGSAQVAMVSEPTLAITFEARIERSSTTLTLLVPHSSIAEVAERIAGADAARRTSGDDDGAARHIRAALGTVEVELRAEAGAIDLPVEAVLALKPGDVVRLGAAEQGVALYASEQLIGRGKPGRSGARRAIQLAGGRL